MTPGALLTPRPMPDRRLPVLLGGAVVALALPIFLLAGWDVRGWALGALLWAGSQLVGLLLEQGGDRRADAARLRGRRLRDDGRAGSCSCSILLAVAVADPSLALAGALVYAAAYSAELAVSLALYFSGSPRR